MLMPLFHIYAMNSALLCGLRVGSASLIVQNFEIVSFFELIDKYNVTIAPIAPPVILAMAKSSDLDKYDLSSIRTVISGGPSLAKELENTMRLKFPHTKLGQVFMIFPCFNYLVRKNWLDVQSIFPCFIYLVRNNCLDVQSCCDD